MNKKDKDSLIIICSILVMPVLFIIFCSTTKDINNLYLLIFALLIQFLYVTPQLTKSYYELNNQRIGISRFIPLYSETLVFNSKLSLIILILWVICMVCIVISFLPISILEKLSFNFAINNSTITLSIAIITYLILNILRGIGYIKVSKIIEEVDYEFSGISRYTSKTLILRNAFLNLLLLIPILRLISLITILSNCNKLIKLNNFKKGDKNEILRKNN